MNKAQREVAEYLLDKEERIIRQLERQYQLALEDVEMDIRILLMDEQTPSRIHRVEYQRRLKKQIETTLETLHRNEYKTINAFLQDSYKDSFVGTMYDLHSQGVPVIVPIDQNAAVKAIQLDTQLSDRKIHPNANGEHVTLYESLGVDVDNLKETIRLEITRGLATNMQPEVIARNISYLTKAPLSRAKTIARTEAHRIQEASAQDAREKAISRGARVVKQWDATMDGATREAHRRLDGQMVEVHEPFVYGTLTAMYPGDFGDPAQDCNCRCKATQRARWMLDEEELETLKRRAEFFGLAEDEAKKEQFEAFRQKFIEKNEHMQLDETVKITKKKGDKKYSSVDAELVNSKRYHDKFEGLTSHKAANESIYQESMRMLEHRDGTPHEDMVLLDSRTGKFVTGNMDSQLVGKTGLTEAQYVKVEAHKGQLTIVHNHPNSSRISYTDILTMYRNPKIDSIVAVGHDGSVQIVYGLNREIDIEKMWNSVYNDVVETTRDRTLAEHAATTYLYDSGVFKTESR